MSVNRDIKWNKNCVLRQDHEPMILETYKPLLQAYLLLPSAQAMHRILIQP
jgi:hypothetical protein